MLLAILASREVFKNQNIAIESVGINIGSSRDVSILELAETVKKVIGFKGKIKFDSSRLNGTPRKLIDSSKINSLGWKHKTNLTEGLKKTYTWYKDQLI